MLIVTDDFTQQSSVTTSALPFNSAMPGTQLRVLQMSERARITTISDTPTFDANLEGSPVGSIRLGFNFVAVLGYDGAPSRNMERQAGRFGVDAAWTVAGFLVGTSVEDSPSGFPFRVWVADVAAGVNTVDQLMGTTKPGKGGSGSAALALSTTRIFKQDSGGGDGDMRIIASDVAGGVTNFARADFDLSAGTVSAATVGGTFTAPIAPAIKALGGDWYLCRLNYTTGTEDTLHIRTVAVTPGGSTTMVGDEQFFWGGPVTMLQTAAQTDAEYPLTIHAGTGPMYQVQIDFATIGGSATNSGWFHSSTRNRLHGFSRYSFWHLYSSPRSEDQVRVELWDPNNALTYIEAGRLIVGNAAELNGSIVPLRYALSFEETGDQIEADGGQIFRAQRTVRRGLPIRLRYSTKQEAFDDYAFLQRIQGRSKQVLVIADETDAIYAQDGLVYGYINVPSVIPLSGYDGVYEWEFEIVEAP